ncbi:mono [ADP-ribose] polymerase PARP16 [Agrilus planipennis]|uniref:Poly [ADP-ribose] polymerase n=1 Tax=Agrilus planipennis TaxID=224129 RepID=A0A1W4WZN9_AGRPL|nr:mono [ADP-ribose] polymerase PARP16 [Agrilus planipennis]
MVGDVNEIRSNSSNELADVFFEKTRKENISRIQKILKINLHGCDLLFCLFYSSLNSFRVEQCLKPLPPGFQSNDTDSIDKLRQICSSLPGLRSLMLDPSHLSAEALAILNYLLFCKNQPLLRRIDLDNFQFPDETDITLLPNHVFEVIYPQHMTDSWNRRKKNHNVIMAFHGSQLENFYSIIRFGLQHHFGNGKIQLFGQGTYLSTELSVSMIFAPFSRNWPKSVLGAKLSIIAVCEVLDIKHKVKKKASSNYRGIGGEIPDKYVVVTDNEVMKIKYLLVYSKREANFRSWSYRNVFAVLLLLYFVFLCIIGSQNSLSITFTRLWNKYIKKHFLQY